VLNRPSAAASNSSKPYQAGLLRAHGFDVPDTLITTTPSALADFRAQHGEVIFKSISGVRSIVSRFTPAHSKRIPDLTWCPTQFQQYVSGHDYRVHVVGDKVYAAEISSQADDYRYAARDGLAAEVKPATLADDLVLRCRSVAAALGLLFAGIDLRLTDEGHWICFEVNPSPGFTYYESATGQPLALAVAQLLSSAGKDATRVAPAVATKETTIRINPLMSPAEEPRAPARKSSAVEPHGHNTKSFRS